jgi:hypothetical protein
MSDEFHVIHFDDEPKAPSLSASSVSGPEPLPIVFEDATPVNTPTDKPTADRGPTVIHFEDTPAPKPAPSKPAAPSPQVATFADPPSPKPSTTRPPKPATPAPIAAVMDASTPNVNRAPAPTEAAVAFGAPKLTEQEQRALDYVRQNAADLFQKAPQAIEGAIRQLLPFSLATLSRWGDTALQANAQVVKDMTDLQRGFSALNVSETIQQALDSRRNHKNLFQRMVATGPVDLNTFRVRAVGLSAQIDQLIPQVETLRTRAKDQASRLTLLLTAMSAAASVGAARLEPAVDIALQNRRTVLTQASQQSQLLLPQIEEIRRQLVEQNAQITQFINVTLPAMDLADAQAPHGR